MRATLRTAHRTATTQVRRPTKSTVRHYMNRDPGVGYVWGWLCVCVCPMCVPLAPLARLRIPYQAPAQVVSPCIQSHSRRISIQHPSAALPLLVECAGHFLIAWSLASSVRSVAADGSSASPCARASFAWTCCLPPAPSRVPRRMSYDLLSCGSSAQHASFSI